MGCVSSSNTYRVLSCCALAEIGASISLGREMKYILLFVIFLSSCAPLPSTIQAAITQTQIATPTITAVPISTRTIRPTQENSKAGCFEWNKVDENMNGEEICVFGNVFFAGSAKDGNGDIVFWLVRFNEEPTTFYVVQEVLPFDIQSGNCISVLGKLQLDDANTPFIENGKITKC